MKPALALVLDCTAKPRTLSTYARLIEWWRDAAATVADQATRPCRARVRSRWAEYPADVLDELERAGVVRIARRTPIAVEIWFEEGQRT